MFGTDCSICGICSSHGRNESVALSSRLRSSLPSRKAEITRKKVCFQCQVLLAIFVNDRKATLSTIFSFFSYYGIRFCHIFPRKCSKLIIRPVLSRAETRLLFSAVSCREFQSQSEKKNHSRSLARHPRSFVLRVRI